jgi:hypothetical protein
MSMTYPTVVGGLRSRLIFDNLFLVVNHGLEQLGWLDGNGRRHQPVHFVVETPDVTSEVPINTLALSSESVTTTPWEIGSQLSQESRYFYLDFFGENEAVSKHIIGDCRDILLGKYTSLGRTGPVLDVWDLRNNGTPSTWLFACDIIDARIDRSHDWSQNWLRYWYSIQATLLDYYTNDADPAPVNPPVWSP